MALLTEQELLGCGWFNAGWYQQQYADVAGSGLSPARHFVKYGSGWGRSPGPAFNAQWYLHTYPDVAQAGLAPLAHFLRHGRQEGRLPVPVKAQEWEQALWGKAQPEHACLAELKVLLQHSALPERSYAAWALARWHAWQQHWPAVAEVLAPCFPLHPHNLPFGPAPWLLYADALTKTGQLTNAAEQLQQLQLAFPDYEDAHLAYANLLAASRPCCKAQQLAAVNAIWQRHHLAPAQLANPSGELELDNLLCSSPKPAFTVPEAGKPLISVIVPVFNAGQGLHTALASLVNQSLAVHCPGSIEILVVDDASTDNSVSIARRFASAYSWIRVLQQPHNQGAYAARNAGLANSRGSFITVHDSDDWSHPQKLEWQLAAMQQNQHWMACNSYWVRCSNQLEFGNWRMESGWIYRNTSSLLFRRNVFEQLGYWDKVRADADTEYYYRIRAAFGASALGEVAKGIPLAFGRAVPGSLSQAGPTHLCTQFAGVRKDYQQAAAGWHQGATKPADLYLPQHPTQRPFPAPDLILP